MFASARGAGIMVLPLYGDSGGGFCVNEAAVAPWTSTTAALIVSLESVYRINGEAFFILTSSFYFIFLL
jgi:hypothetical protein